MKKKITDLVKSTAAAQAKPRPTAWDQVTGAVESYDPFASFENRYQ